VAYSVVAAVSMLEVVIPDQGTEHREGFGPITVRLKSLTGVMTRHAALATQQQQPGHHSQRSYTPNGFEGKGGNLQIGVCGACKCARGVAHTQAQLNGHEGNTHVL
jgi:hypothetical protein